MYTYLIMQNPSHNRVYYNQAGKLSLAELKIACERFENKCQDIELLTIAGINYLSVKVENQITKKELLLLSRLSFVFALFELVEVNREKHLLPIAKSNYAYINPKISSLLKYPGKTNELFTKMMVNVGLLSSNFDYHENIQLLDPLAGKGTTLFEGAVYGFDVAGIEIKKKSVHEVGVFFKKYLEKEKYKHKATKRKVYGENKSNSSYIQEFEYAASKDEFKKENSRRKLRIVSGNSANANRYFKNNSFHIIVGDLPYGVAHGNAPKNKYSSLTRNPSELLIDCLPGWYKVLKKNGVLVLAWNKFVMPKDDFIRILKNNAFNVFTESAYNEFEHRVDRSIKRDIIVATK